MFLLLALLTFNAYVAANIINITIDDTYGDSVTGLQPIYSPSVSEDTWTATCTNCFVVPNPTFAYNGTWHHATDGHSGITGLTATFSFNGTALYVFCIVPNYNGTASGASTWTNMTFTLDGESAGNYSLSPSINTNPSSFFYNQVVFSNESLTNGSHTFVIEPIDGAVILFDYAIYTQDNSILVTNPTNSTNPTDSPNSTDSPNPTDSPNSTDPSNSHESSSTGAIVGGVIGALLIVLVAAIFFWLYVRRRNASKKSPETFDPRLNSLQGGAGMNP